MVSAAGWAVDADGLDPEHFEPTDVGQGIADGRHLPVEDRADLTTGEGKIARLGVAVHQSHFRARLGLALAQRLMQPLEGGQRIALDAVHLCGPVVELAVEVVVAVVERVQPGLFEVDGVDRRYLFGQALAHPRHGLVGRIVKAGGRLHFVDVPDGALHDKERLSENLAAGLEPQRQRCANRGVLQRAQDGELASKVVRLQQRGRFGPQPQHHVLAGVFTAVPCHDGQHHHLGGTPEVHPVHTFDPDVVGVGQLGAQPTGQPLNDIGVQRHCRAPSPLAGRRSTGVLSCLNADMSIAAQFG